MDVSMLSSNLLVVYAKQFTNKTFRFYTKHTAKKDLDDIFVSTSSKSFLFYIIFSSITVQVHILPPMYYEEYKDMHTTELAEEVKRRIEKVIEENIM